MLQFVIIANASGVIRLAKWYAAADHARKIRTQTEAFRHVSQRRPQQSNFIPFEDGKTLVFRQYERVYFIFCIEETDNELAYLEAIHQFVEVLDCYFVRVKEPHLQFFFHRVYSLLEEVFLAGEMHEIDLRLTLERVRAIDVVST